MVALKQGNSTQKKVDTIIVTAGVIAWKGISKESHRKLDISHSEIFLHLEVAENVNPGCWWWWWVKGNRITRWLWRTKIGSSDHQQLTWRPLTQTLVFRCQLWRGYRCAGQFCAWTFLWALGRSQTRRSEVSVCLLADLRSLISSGSTNAPRGIVSSTKRVHLVWKLVAVKDRSIMMIFICEY